MTYLVCFQRSNKTPNRPAYNYVFAKRWVEHLKWIQNNPVFSESMMSITQYGPVTFSRIDDSLEKVSHAIHESPVFPYADVQVIALGNTQASAHKHKETQGHIDSTLVLNQEAKLIYDIERRARDA
ncbi:hypothetical protein [Sulfobacillus thermosulfidooxidans]|uniref:hypothetical protein n=1 Tax=Sulfobacillus thermosulfidooxidans TaxID=28034 RepID=UPI00037DFE08|nr:hypothetical protein [Sulfobacillus thermosulfidooxidans]